MIFVSVYRHSFEVEMMVYKMSRSLPSYFSDPHVIVNT